jgi:phenylacetate-CoA ligase
MKKPYWDPEAECAPVPELAARLEERLATTDLFRRAARSPLYGPRWQAAGVDPAAIHSYADLQKVPYTDSSDLRAAQATHHPDEFVCSDERPRLWVSTSGSTGVPKWIPIGSGDLETSRRVAFRTTYFGDRPASRKDVALGVLAPAPFISDTSLWPGLVNELRGDGPRDVESGEGILLSFEDAADSVSMALKRRITVVVAFPSLLMRIAEGISQEAPKAAEALFRRKRSLLTLLAYLFTKARKVRPRDMVRVHSGIFAGEPLAPYRKALYDAWGLKLSYDYYTFSEYQVVLLECSAQDGLHVWLDVSLPEIIYQADLDREREEEGFVPPAHPLWQASAGDEGELVLTHWGDAFPLVRWRTSDLVRVVSTQPCSCGRTLPRVHFLQRSDDKVNLGVVRMSTFELKEKLDGISRPAAVARWQLRVGRRGYKPLLRVLVRPASTVDEAEMVAAVKAAVDELQALRAGIDNGLICEVEVAVATDLEDRLSTSGKFRPLVYEMPGEANGG